jgi:hypothetical protein
MSKLKLVLQFAGLCLVALATVVSVLFVVVDMVLGDWVR